MNKPIDISNIVLKTERLILRPWTLDDVDDMYEYASVEGVGIWAGWLPHKNREESKSIVEMFIEDKKVLALEFEGKVIERLEVEKFDLKLGRIEISSKSIYRRRDIYADDSS